MVQQVELILEVRCAVNQPALAAAWVNGCFHLTGHSMHTRTRAHPSCYPPPPLPPTPPFTALLCLAAPSHCCSKWYWSLKSGVQSINQHLLSVSSTNAGETANWRGMVPDHTALQFSQLHPACGTPASCATPSSSRYTMWADDAVLDSKLTIRCFANLRGVVRKWGGVHPCQAGLVVPWWPTSVICAKLVTAQEKGYDAPVVMVC